MGCDLSPPLVFNLAHPNGGKSGFGAKVGALLRFKRGVRRASAPQDIPHAHSLPPPMIPPPPKATPKAWWHQFAPGKPPPRRDPFEGPYRGPFIRSFTTVQPSSPACPAAIDTADHPVFGKPLKDSLQYASVQISTANANGDLYVWGYIPVVVAKWSVPFSCLVFSPHLPQWPLSQGKWSVLALAAFPCRSLRCCPIATEVQGTFRVNGSNRRMRDLQVAFESPPRVSRKSPILHPTRSSVSPHSIMTLRSASDSRNNPRRPFRHPYRPALSVALNSHSPFSTANP
jgi:hypothetical protein